VRTLANQIAAALKEPDGVRLVAEIAGVLALEAGDEGARTALWIVESAVPEAQRREITDATGDVAYALALTKDEGVATALLDWVARHKSASATQGLVAVNEALSAAVRERALSLAKEIRPGRA
jgi:hypothetical protein